MAFPDDIETGIGLAGPTADIGHEAAHAASGIPRLLEAIQTSIGTLTSEQVATPTWTTSVQPSINQVDWVRIGPIAWIGVYALWGSAATLTNGFCEFTLPAGFGTQMIGNVYGSGVVYVASESQFRDASIVVTGGLFRVQYWSSTGTIQNMNLTQGSSYVRASAVVGVS